MWTSGPGAALRLPSSQVLLGVFLECAWGKPGIGAKVGLRLERISCCWEHPYLQEVCWLLAFRVKEENGLGCSLDLPLVVLEVSATELGSNGCS